MERAHIGLVGDLDAASGAYRADVRDPVCLEDMALVNSLCSWLKHYLWRLTGMSMPSMPGYLTE